MALLALVLLCVTAPLELSQIAFALVGAIAYALIHATQLSTPRRPAAAAPFSKTVTQCGTFALPQQRITAALKSQAQKAHSDVRNFSMQSSQPVVPPTFTAAGWDAEVDELLSQISPTQEGDKVVQQLALIIKRTLRKTIPEVEVVGFASGDLVRGTAFGVAVPEVDIVVSASPSILAQRLQGRLAAKGTAPLQLDMRRLQKSAIRACTDRLVSGGGFKFRRSAFRGQEPKVTLLAPASLGIYAEAIPIDFSVNSTTPLYNAALLTECGQMEARAKSLILLVRRWAKDRGVCHAAKGHLSPYAWTLLTIFFLQAGLPDGEGPLLPPLEGFRRSSGLAGQQPTSSGSGAGGAAQSAWKPAVAATAGGPPPAKVGTLFKAFARFYGGIFDWRNEAVSVRLGRRAPPDLDLPLHIVEQGSETEVGPSLEDPFDRRRNLGECMTAQSLARLREELARAAELCQRDRPLAELLEPWVPPERGGGFMDACDEDLLDSADLDALPVAPAAPPPRRQHAAGARLGASSR